MFLAADGRIPESDRHRAERDNKRRKKKPRSRKPWELDSEGEETSDGSSTEKVRGLYCDTSGNQMEYIKIKSFKINNVCFASICYMFAADSRINNIGNEYQCQIHILSSYIFIFYFNISWVDGNCVALSLTDS